MATEALECNGCGCLRQSAHNETADSLRDRLADVGWLSDKARDLDYCPRCIVSKGLGS